MTDITLHFSALDWIVIALALGWPGLLLGGALGAFAWTKRRIAGGVLGAVLGCGVLFLVRVLAL